MEKIDIKSLQVDLYNLLLLLEEFDRNKNTKIEYDEFINYINEKIKDIYYSILDEYHISAYTEIL